jgi:hypothetical protein
MKLTECLFIKSIALDVRFIQNMGPLVDHSGRKLNSTDIDFHVGPNLSPIVLLQGFTNFLEILGTIAVFWLTE